MMTESTWTIARVAQRLQVRYQRARDLMLSGKLGPTRWEGRALYCVDDKGMLEFEKTRGPRKVSGKAL